MNPLDLSAGPFLELYIFLAFAGLIICFYLRASIGGEATVDRPLTPLEMAYLASGPRRVGDTLIVSLATEGKVTVAPDGKSIDVAEDAVLPKEFNGSVDVSLSGQATRSKFQNKIQPVVNEIRERLTRMGLVPDEDQLAMHRTQILLFLGGPLLLGLAKIVVGLERNKPVGFLVALSIALAVAGVIFLIGPRLTRAGKEELRTQQSAYARAARAPLDTEFTVAVALSGLIVLQGTPHQTIYTASTNSAWGGGDGGGGGGCSGGGDGGGGCGGGCGGCGGG